MCEVLEEIRNENKEWFDKEVSAVFTEIGLAVDDKIMPSSRFLKLFVHNVCEYLIDEDPNQSPLIILQNAFTKALQNDVFHQKICKFNDVGETRILTEIDDIKCVASGHLVALVLGLLKP